MVKGIVRGRVNREKLKEALILRSIFNDYVYSNSEILYKYFL